MLYMSAFQSFSSWLSIQIMPRLEVTLKCYGTFGFGCLCEADLCSSPPYVRKQIIDHIECNWH